MLRRKTVFIFGFCSTALLAGGFSVAPPLKHAAQPGITLVQATISTAPAIEATATIPEKDQPTTAEQQSPSKPPVTSNPATSDPDDEKAVAARLVFDRALVDAAVLNTEYENFKRGRSKKPISLSAFRSLELQLNTIADADPANTQARDMANLMKMRQYEILQPSVEIAASANRLLYAHAMAERMHDDGMRVVVSGRDNSSVRFTSPHMTRQMAMQLSESAKIPEKAKALQFRRVVFGNGRRSWTYDLKRGRLR